MAPDPNQPEHTFDPQYIRGWPVLDPDIFWPSSMRFFWPGKKKIKNFSILRGNFPNPEVADPTRPGSKFFWPWPIPIQTVYWFFSLSRNTAKEILAHWSALDHSKTSIFKIFTKIIINSKTFLHGLILILFIKFTRAQGWK